MARLTIAGVDVPTPAFNGLTIKREKVWAPKTGRASNGELIGYVVAVKTTLSIQWPPLTRQEVQLIDSLVTDNDFFSVKYLSPRTNTYVTETFYAGTPTYPVYSYADGKKTYKGVSVDLIQK